MIQTYEEIADPKDVRNNRLHIADRAFHDWYRFILSFPPHLVRTYLNRFELAKGATLLDPFCGTGTTLVEAKKQSVAAVGIEAIPTSHFASTVKTSWQLKTSDVKRAAERILYQVSIQYSQSTSLKSFTSEQQSVVLANSICELPLHKCLLLLETIQAESVAELRGFLLLALVYVAVYEASNLRFGPEVSVRRKRKEDADVFESWYAKVLTMLNDLTALKELSFPLTICHLADARSPCSVLAANSIDAVITSPPYPNEKDYTRTTRLESVLLGFLKNKSDLRTVKNHLLRSNSRNVYAQDDDDRLIAAESRVARIAQEIERKRIELGKTSGFERKYHRATRLYFGGMKRHLAELRTALKPGAQLAYVVGDQASYLKVLIRTGELLAGIADELGYEISSIDLFRTRTSSVTNEQLREEVLVLEWPGFSRQISIDFGFEAARLRQYDRLIENVFFEQYQPNTDQVIVELEALQQATQAQQLNLSQGLSSVLHAYGFKRSFPKRIVQLLDEGETWVIRSLGRGRFAFVRCAVSCAEAGAESKGSFVNKRPNSG
ncbi:DNA methyltransferase [Romeria aff. gracilis LEGE 07310]|uniref:site-specific DNA-methyltransferase (cytosine-N(4)-specific) n=2 Tax=Vasconcelosia TaxID=3366328 RepID=A0A8J7DL73_9CYAN|nr:DNA methyltransferase [Romeria aff. gracilis LEGE 07310]